MKFREKTEIISIECKREKLIGLKATQISIDKKYDFKAHNPILGSDNAFEIDVYLVISDLHDNQLLHLIMNVKILTAPDGNSLISDAINVHARLNGIYEYYWGKICSDYGINQKMLIAPYFDINVVEKVFEYLVKWGYYQ